ELPLTSITSILAVLLVAIFFVTSSDSGSLVIDMLTSKFEEESPVWQRIFWALLEGTVAIALLIAGGLGALQAATLASALPFTVIMLLMCWGLFRALRLDVMKRASIRDAHPLPQGAAAAEWKTRLQTLVRQPGKREVLQFLREQVHPALEAVAGELQAQGVQARVESDDEGGGRVWLRVGHGEEMDFFYSAHLEAYDPPSFVMEDP